MVAGVITFVACNKDSESNQITNPSFPSAKGNSTLNHLRNVMVAYYAACDSAYQADSTTFLSVCANNDTTNFLKVTGISSEMMATYHTLALQELEDFVKDNPSFKPDENPCTSCSYNALPRLGTLASATSGHMAALVPFKIGGNDRQRLANCISWCEMMTTPCGMTACISACMGEYININPYDLFGVRLKSYFVSLKKMIDDKDFSDYEDGLNKAQLLLNTIGETYPAITDDEAKIIDMDYIGNIITVITSTKPIEILSVARDAEIMVMQNIQSSSERDLYLRIISEVKYVTEYSSSVLYTNIPYEDRLNNCIEYETDQIFNHSTWIKQAMWIAGIPESFLALAAECALAAALYPDDPRMSF